MIYTQKPRAMKQELANHSSLSKHQSIDWVFLNDQTVTVLNFESMRKFGIKFNDFKIVSLSIKSTIKGPKYYLHLISSPLSIRL